MITPAEFFRPLVARRAIAIESACTFLILAAGQYMMMRPSMPPPLALAFYGWFVVGIASLGTTGIINDTKFVPRAARAVLLVAALWIVFAVLYWWLIDDASLRFKFSPGTTLLFLSLTFLGFVPRSVRTLLEDVSPIVAPPGTTTRSVLAFLFSSRTVREVFEPVLADTQHDWMQACVAGHTRHAQWIRVRGYLTLFTHFLGHIGVNMISFIVGAIKKACGL